MLYLKKKIELNLCFMFINFERVFKIQKDIWIIVKFLRSFILFPFMESLTSIGSLNLCDYNMN